MLTRNKRRLGFSLPAWGYICVCAHPNDLVKNSHQSGSIMYCIYLIIVSGRTCRVVFNKLLIVARSQQNHEIYISLMNIHNNGTNNPDHRLWIVF